MKVFFVLLLSLCLPFLSVRLFSQTAQVCDTETLESLSAEIHTQLESLRQQSRSLTEQLLIAEKESETLSKQAEALRMELTELNSCLENTNRRLQDYKTKLTEYEHRLNARKKALLILCGILLAMAASKIILQLLRFKGIKVPYLLALWL